MSFLMMKFNNSSSSQKFAPLAKHFSVGLVSFVGVFFVSGCAQIAGIEKRTEGDAVLDGNTDISTTTQCIEYCNEVTASCADENAVYEDRSACINTCNALVVAEANALAADPESESTNTIECRMKRATSASTDPNENCAAAGPGSDGSCSTHCRSWCTLLQQECFDQYSTLTDCEASCESLADPGGFSLKTSSEADDVQCRIIALGRVGGDADSESCNEANYVASDTCVPADDSLPECSRYCSVVQANCVDTEDSKRALYASNSDCLKACVVLERGTIEDLNDNTVGCRTYHGRAAATDPGFHCSHASPGGDGQCGVDNEAEGTTGNCDSYCGLFENACDAEFQSAFTDSASCQLSCPVLYDNSGARMMSGYAANAEFTPEKALQCRIAAVVSALGGDSDACGRASPDSTCE